MTSPNAYQTAANVLLPNYPRVSPNTKAAVNAIVQDLVDHDMRPAHKTRGIVNARAMGLSKHKAKNRKVKGPKRHKARDFDYTTTSGRVIKASVSVRADQKPRRMLPGGALNLAAKMASRVLHKRGVEYQPAKLTPEQVKELIKSRYETGRTSSK